MDETAQGSEKNPTVSAGAANVDQSGASGGSLHQAATSQTQTPTDTAQNPNLLAETHATNIPQMQSAGVSTTNPTTNPQVLPNRANTLQTLGQSVQKARETLLKDTATEGGEDWFDKMTASLTADQSSTLARVLKKVFPVIIMLFTMAFGVGLGKNDLVSGCIRGMYGEISMFFGLLKIPLYSVPLDCTFPDKARDFISIRPLVFIGSFVIIYFVWRFFDKKLEWRGRGNLDD